MNYYIDRSLYAIRKVCIAVTRKKNFFIKVDSSAIEGQQASDLIYDALSKDKPCMVCRFGSGELTTVLTYLTIRDKSKKYCSKIFDFLLGKMPPPFWSFRIKNNLCNNAGFFSVDEVLSEQHLEKFCELYLDCMQNVDILGSWVSYEEQVKERMPNTKYVPLGLLEPYNHTLPWSRVLKGKKVLVIHPFSDTIEEQYKKREKLFKNPDVLPEFKLETIKAVQSIAGNIPEGYSNWFEALDGMKKQISQKDFDIALIGCGAYGFPLASYVKDIGKKAVHFGGALQILFGIKGRRWELEYEYDKVFYNDFWVYPSEADKPQNYKKIESGCYW
ncbi:MAG: hypothetical protein FWD87_07700 [Spirochaetaceae bacterium]|nr:hypothetical protein [Spirochaetaceae bacterium]